MEKASISDANLQLAELYEWLDHAYWEASTMADKDLFHDLISALHCELAELAKLSIQDHGMDYEPISLEFRRAKPRLQELRKSIDVRISRAATATKLESTLSTLSQLLPD